MIDTILIPVDGSAASRRAVDFGADLAVRYAARVVLLHVLLRQNLAEGLRGLDEIGRDGGDGLRGLADALGQMPLEKLAGAAAHPASPPREVLDFIAKGVIEYAEKVVRSKGITNVIAAVEDGDPVKRILEYAEKENADAIVMGARGLSDIEGLLLGSVSHRVSNLANRTCITVR